MSRVQKVWFTDPDLRIIFRLLREESLRRGFRERDTDDNRHLVPLKVADLRRVARKVHAIQDERREQKRGRSVSPVEDHAGRGVPY